MAHTPQRTLLSWSSGKDSAWALHLLRQDPGIEIAALLTTFNGAADRVAMHAVRRELVEAQAQRMELPLWSIDLPWPCPNAVYEDLMRSMLRRAREEGITAIAFGDLFLQDIRDYRERQMNGTGLKPLFPVWQIPTGELAGEMLRSGVKAKVTCIDLAKLDASYAGRDYDREFLSSLPSGIDPCGENGEFHSFVYDAPVFSSAIKVEVGGTLERDGFAFADVLPA
jgi:uncharacterized protein (TIGR00290 family)